VKGRSDVASLKSDEMGEVRRSGDGEGKEIDEGERERERDARLTSTSTCSVRPAELSTPTPLS